MSFSCGPREASLLQAACLAGGPLKRTPLFEQRFIVDLDENTPITLQFWQPNTARLCFLCE